MLHLQHNHHTSLQAIAKKLNDKLKEVQNYYNIKELQDINSREFVSISKTSLKDDLSLLVKSIESNNKSVLPKIIVAKGNAVRTDNLTELNFSKEIYVQLEEIDNQNIVITPADEPIYLKGKAFSYEVDIQIILLTSTEYTSIELQLELKRIINEELKKVTYDVRLFDDEDTNSLYRVKDFGSVGLYGFENAPFEIQSDAETQFYAHYITGELTEKYYKLSTDRIFKKYEIAQNIHD